MIKINDYCSNHDVGKLSQTNKQNRIFSAKHIGKAELYSVNHLHMYIITDN